MMNGNQENQLFMYCSICVHDIFHHVGWSLQESRLKVGDNLFWLKPGTTFDACLISKRGSSTWHNVSGLRAVVFLIFFFNWCSAIWHDLPSSTFVFPCVWDHIKQTHSLSNRVRWASWWAMGLHQIVSQGGNKSLLEVIKYRGLAEFGCLLLFIYSFE